MRRILLWAAMAASLVLLVAPPAQATPVHAATTSTFSMNWPGLPAAPALWSGQGFNSTWDVQIHKRSIGDTMDPMDAQHGSDCAAPPASHPISMLAQGVFLCRNHLMTAIIAGDYGEIALTADHLVDFSSGTATIQVNVSTLQLNPFDWIEVWVTPYAESITLPFTGQTDLQGPPKDGLRFSLNHSGDEGTYAGDINRFDTFVKTTLPKASTAPLDVLVPPSATTRSTYQIDLSQTHVRFGLPGVGVGGTWWTDTSLTPLTYTQGIVQLVHHSYNPIKHCVGCAIDTWHWSDFYISNAIPFTILPGVERSISPATTTVHFSRPSLANSFLRFSGIGTITVSYDGGATWQAVQIQSQRDAHSDHFSTYWTPAPVGVNQVMFRGVNWYGGSWWVRDPAIWSLSTIPVQAPPSRSASGGGGGNAPHNPPVSAQQPSTTTNLPVYSAQQPSTTNPPAAQQPSTTNPPAGRASSGSSPSGSSISAAKPVAAAPNLVMKLVSSVNPNQDPVIKVLVLFLVVGALVAVIHFIRGRRSAAR